LGAEHRLIAFPELIEVNQKLSLIFNLRPYCLLSEIKAKRGGFLSYQKDTLARKSSETLKSPESHPDT
jgi:hypothetical protein